MASLVKARAARKAQLDKKRQEEEEARKKAEEEKNPPKPPPLPVEKSIESIPQSSPTESIPEKKESTVPPVEEKPVPPVQKTIQPQDLFLIPPSFSFVDLQNKMNNVSISPVPTTTKLVPKKPQPPTSIPTEKQQKKRKRQESESSDEEESDSSNDEPTNSSSTSSTQKKAFQSKFKPKGVAKPGGSASSSLMEKARGLYSQATSYLPPVSDSIRNNMVLSVVSILLVVVRAALQQRNFGRMQAAPPIQNIQATLPPSNPPPPTSYIQNPTPSYNMINPGDYRGYGK